MRERWTFDREVAKLEPRRDREGSNPTADERVQWAQNVLNKIQGERLRPDGLLGPKTKSALRQFQHENGLRVNGQLDESTEIAVLQRTLEAIRGESLFAAIGALDSATVQALRRFQSDHGLRPSDRPDPASRQRMTEAIWGFSPYRPPVVPDATPAVQQASSSSQQAGPFPLIVRLRPHEYDKALQAEIEYQRAKWFEGIYFRLYNATIDAALQLDDRYGAVVVAPKKESVLGLLAHDVGQTLLEEKLITPTGEKVFGKGFGTWSSAAGLVWTLLDIKTAEDARRLVANQYDGGEGEEEAHKRKLSFFMDVMAANPPFPMGDRTPAEIKGWLRGRYFWFKPIWERRLAYQELERSLREGGRRQHPSMWPNVRRRTRW